MKSLWKRIRKAIREWWRENIVDTDPWEDADTQPFAVEERQETPVETPAQTPQEEPGEPETPSAPPEPSPAPSMPLEWRYGGFNGAKADEDARCRISALKVSSAGCSLKWESGIPGDWKRSAEGFVVCAIFFRDGEKWVGGKFDWIDEARKTRDFKNISGHYNGWNSAAFFAAKNHAFCVVSADGKWRSNLIED